MPLIPQGCVVHLGRSSPQCSVRTPPSAASVPWAGSRKTFLLPLRLQERHERRFLRCCERHHPVLRLTGCGKKEKTTCLKKASARRNRFPISSRDDFFLLFATYQCRNCLLGLLISDSSRLIHSHSPSPLPSAPHDSPCLALLAPLTQL